MFLKNNTNLSNIFLASLRFRGYRELMMASNVMLKYILNQNAENLEVGGFWGGLDTC